MTTLKTFERNVLLGLVLIVFSLFVAAGLKSSQEKIMKIDETVEFVTVSIQGAVKRPGVYLVPLGSSSKSALRKSRPTSRADLRFLKDEPYIEGAVEWVIKEIQDVENEDVKVRPVKKIVKKIPSVL